MKCELYSNDDFDIHRINCWGIFIGDHLRMVKGKGGFIYHSVHTIAKITCTLNFKLHFPFLSFFSMTEALKRASSP